jgi:hypothetical protein
LKGLSKILICIGFNPSQSLSIWHVSGLNELALSEIYYLEILDKTDLYAALSTLSILLLECTPIPPVL